MLCMSKYSADIRTAVQMYSCGIGFLSGNTSGRLHIWCFLLWATFQNDLVSYVWWVSIAAVSYMAVSFPGAYFELSFVRPFSYFSENLGRSFLTSCFFKTRARCSCLL